MFLSSVLASADLSFKPLNDSPTPTRLEKRARKIPHRGREGSQIRVKTETVRIWKWIVKSQSLQELRFKQTRRTLTFHDAVYVEFWWYSFFINFLFFWLFDLSTATHSWIWVVHDCDHLSTIVWLTYSDYSVPSVICSFLFSDHEVCLSLKKVLWCICMYIDNVMFEPFK